MYEIPPGVVVGPTGDQVVAPLALVETLNFSEFFWVPPGARELTDALIEARMKVP